MDEACLGDDTLLDFVAGRLPDDRRGVVERHLAGCTICTRLVSAAEGSARETVPAPNQTRGLPRTGELDVRERQPSLNPGTLLAETYKIVRLIGTGGMGEVYEASHTRLTGRYAVKVLHHHWAGDPRAIVRFGREAQITSGLRHPNIVAIIDFDYTPAGAPYLVMEFIDGVELAAVIAAEAPLQPARVVRIVDQIASALTAVHARNIVHRDLKPQNIFLVPGERPGDERVKLVDFGISKVRAASVALTGERAVLGTPQYMAPEQAQAAGEVDGRADQFALAAIVYEMLTGRMAFPGDRVEIVVYRISHEEPRPLGPAWGPGLASVIMRALAKNPAQRYPSTDDFAAALRAAVEGDRLVRTPSSETRITQRQPSQDSPPPLGPETRERHIGHRWTVVGGVSAGLALAAVLAVPLMRRPARHDSATSLTGAAPVPAATTATANGELPPPPKPAAAASTDMEPPHPEVTTTAAKETPPVAATAVAFPAAGERRHRLRAHAATNKARAASDQAAAVTAPASTASQAPPPDAAAPPALGKSAGTSTRGSKLGSLIDKL
ncbi:MAG TPA: protein kinase [Polyangia bacterium]|nr:protein kinase [Polyangia bacterium]